MPIVDTPGYAAFPSGHATQAFLAARLLATLGAHPVGGVIDMQLQALAIRVAQNREVAGVHFAADSSAGRVLGESLADYVQWACGGGLAQIQPCHFDGANFYGPPGALISNADAGLNTPLANFAVNAPAALAGGVDPLLDEMWRRAQGEWR